MKRWIAILLAALLLAAGSAGAEGFPVGVFVYLQDGTEIVLGENEKLGVKFTSDMEEYTLQIGDCDPVSDTVSVTADAQLMAVMYESGLFFFVGGGYENATNCYHVYEYSYGDFYRMPGEFIYCDGDGNPARTPRATQYKSFFVDLYDISSLGGFVHEQEYVIASNSLNMDYDEAYFCGIYEVPRDMYPFGRVVGIREDLPLFASREDSEAALMLHADDTAVIVASDGEEWARIAMPGGEGESTTYGWMRIQGFSFEDPQQIRLAPMTGIWIGG